MPRSPLFPINTDVELNTRNPPVQTAATWAREYQSNQAPIVDAKLLTLSQGSPGYAPPTIFTDRIAAEGGNLSAHAYTLGLGEPVLREAVAHDMNSAYRIDLPISAENIAITCGCNMAFAATIAAIALRGDSVVLPFPWYFNHEMTLTAMGINVIPVLADQADGTVDPENIRAAISDRVRAVVLVTPSNPSGTIYPAEKLETIARICQDKHVALILDETYREFVLDTDSPAPHDWKPPHGLFASQIAGREWDWTQTIIHLFSFSKSFAIPGHRLGGIACSPYLLESKDGSATRYGPICKVLDNLQVCPPRADTQRAVAWALSNTEHRAWRLQMSNAVWSRLVLFKNVLEQVVPQGGDAIGIPDVPATSAAALGWRIESMGAYYAFVHHPFAVDSTTVAHALAVLCGAVSVPSTCFAPANAADKIPCLRFSVANVSDDLIRELPQRLVWLMEIFTMAPTNPEDAAKDEIELRMYPGESALPHVMALIAKELSEPYQIYTYRYFLNQWPRLCYIAYTSDNTPVGVIIGKMDRHLRGSRLWRGYIAMLSVDTSWRRHHIGSRLVQRIIDEMTLLGTDEIVLETEQDNHAALALYERHGFIREKRLYHFYLNGNDAFRLVLPLVKQKQKPMPPPMRPPMRMWPGTIV
ncbi:hypothetical protein MCUN1_001288 [Malassezia cuniculi]|uniref:N-acetyltransferase domain-containing protein n=1 Tax=Malassezia cuniculi TaxID=948313 RepID=A0AAF0EXC6_9BASI|nr:hypothetical protein MCUN1_001288 [Malassezia cuniculi]